MRFVQRFLSSTPLNADKVTELDAFPRWRDILFITRGFAWERMMQNR
jgi:hypothetical protein